MQYKLTEEQSTKFYTDLKDAISLIDRLQEAGVFAFESLYADYRNNHKSIFGFKPMSIEKFGKKISHNKGIMLGPDGDSIYTIDGWTASLKGKKIAKMTNNDYIDIIGDLNIISAACIAYMSRNYEYKEWTDMVNKIENYMQVPYTISNDWLEKLESLETDTEYYRLVMRNRE